MHQDVKECDEAQHAAKTNDPVSAGNMPQWRNGQRDQYKTQAPVAEAVLDFFDRVCAEAPGNFERVCDDQRRRYQAQAEDQRLPDKSNLADRIDGVSNFCGGSSRRRGAPPAYRSH